MADFPFKKVIYIANARIPTEKAHGYQISKMSESFAKLGVAVELWLPRRKLAEAESLFDTYGLQKNFTIRTFWIFDFLKKGRPLQSFFYLAQTGLFLMKLVLVRFPHDAIAYTRNPEVAYVLSLKGVDVTYEDHGWPKHRMGFYMHLLKRVKHVVTITKGIESLYKNRTSKKPFVAPDAVDFEDFQKEVSIAEVKKQFGIPQDKKIVMYTGSFYFYSWKGVDVLLEAAQYLTPEVQLVLIGANPKELSTLQAHYNQPNILIVGRQSRQDIPTLVKSADLLVLPNKKGDVISELYTSPLKLFEYMAAHIPIVASRLPSIEEILNETNSYLVEPNEPKALADGINLAVSQPDQSKRKADKAYQEVQYHTWVKRAKRILEFIAQSH